MRNIEKHLEIEMRKFSVFKNKQTKFDVASIMETVYFVENEPYCVKCKLPLKSNRSLAKLSKYSYFDGEKVTELDRKLANDIFNVFGSFDILLEKDTLHIKARINTFCNNETCEMREKRQELWLEHKQELENRKDNIAKYNRVIFSETDEKELLEKRELLRKELVQVKNTSEKSIKLGVEKMRSEHHRFLLEKRAQFRKEKENRIKAIKAELARIDSIINSTQKFFA
jgi:ElaB/YqjD/DUF883 family membrane-anchored ribosome-binding protein